MMTRAGPWDSPAVRNRSMCGHSIEVSAIPWRETRAGNRFKDWARSLQ
jgi:hypothetical protein